MPDPPADDGAVRLVDHPLGTVLLLDRPGRRNALTLPMWRALGEQVRRVGQDSAAPLYLLGAGGYFCSGADLRTLARARESGRRAQEFCETVVTALLAVHAARREVVAVVEGGAAGGGVEIMAACDRRVAVGSPALVFPFGRHGMRLDGLTRWRLESLVGAGETARLVDGHHSLAADEASRIGLLEERHTSMAAVVRAEAGRISRQARRVGSYARPGEDLDATVRRAVGPMLAGFNADR